MITEKMTRELIGRQAYDARGEKVGKIGQIYLDERSGTPTWATVNTGLFGMKESFVPLDGADVKGDDVALGVQKDAVKDAPHVGQTSEHLSGREEDELRRHYDVSGDRTATGDGNGRAAAGDARGTREDTRDHDRADNGSMTRHEERLRVGTESEETGKVRLRKYVVTEDQQVTVPVSHEEVRLEREPIADGTPAAGNAKIGEDAHEVTLHAERPVVDKSTEAVEKVRLDTRTVTEDHTVSDEVRKEQVEVDDPNHQVSGRDGRDRH
ncbi:DUF2382 domain-containing protein [Pseudonocardia sp. KRD291]|uniref:DUF2382 domain-containing protein n=1 Tax=Pseudonocardia sp. KRD291 TaxID=2792007 RepID=UPI001C49F1EC|nr:PRC and DUF2382 domain-containing protein [Pseudonocardia sp. KRD291]MBW0101814.1 PRC and DUF2382 domain-containing protein [Pseudonocardia sp. KRD291]